MVANFAPLIKVNAYVRNFARGYDLPTSLLALPLTKEKAPGKLGPFLLAGATGLVCTSHSNLSQRLELRTPYGVVVLSPRSLTQKKKALPTVELLSSGGSDGSRTRDLHSDSVAL